MKSNPHNEELLQSLIRLVIGHLEHVGMLKVEIDGTYSKQPAVITELWEEWCETDAELTGAILNCFHHWPITIPRSSTRAW
jgi:hypothetical protein